MATFRGVPSKSLLYGVDGLNCYGLTSTQMKTFINEFHSSNALWSLYESITEITTNIVSCHWIPKNLGYGSMGDRISRIKLGKITLTNSYGELLNNVTQATDFQKQYTSIDFGDVTITKPYSNYLSYEPYTRVSIVLPFSQTVELNPSQVMGKTIQLKAVIDLFSGEGLYQIGLGSEHLLIGEYPFKCLMPLTITQDSFTQSISRSWQSAFGSAAVSRIATQITSVAETALNSATNLVGTLVGGMNDKDSFTQYSGMNSGFSGFMGNLIPYVIITYPKTVVSSSF